MVDISHREIGPDTVVVTLSGKLIMGPEGEKIVTLVEDAVKQGKRVVVFDLSSVTALDSTGVGRFISSFNKLGAAGGEMRMAGASGHVFQTFHVSLLDQVFRFFPTTEEALKG